ncbi:hypothetical protein AVEN_95506-1 [Araneus ventricosus]|uniref:Uncharacterized protein n=1 Tax=Araneus ventricosus TaxID=182803 RepID=A0A4Y2PD14_ARAVE|nr:hypothetical protein AVEN_95506-1 [Araneus ventricosus]
MMVLVETQLFHEQPDSPLPLLHPFSSSRSHNVYRCRVLPGLDRYIRSVDYTVCRRILKDRSDEKRLLCPSRIDSMGFFGGVLCMKLFTKLSGKNILGHPLISFQKLYLVSS